MCCSPARAAMRSRTLLGTLIVVTASGIPRRIPIGSLEGYRSVAEVPSCPEWSRVRDDLLDVVDAEHQTPSTTRLAGACGLHQWWSIMVPVLRAAVGIIIGAIMSVFAYLLVRGEY